ncbi:MAG: InlB B-repeat-containing protein [Christensenellaceae bacterium]|nr:InlB B-repeat-containing protein [Christensenellaceae bacterium]
MPKTATKKTNFRSKKEKKFLTLCGLLGACCLFLALGFVLVTGPVNITFDVDPKEDAIKGNYIGDKMTPVTKVSNGKVTLPTPIRPGYRFLGWSTDLDGNKMVGKVSKRKMHLYAQWTENAPIASLYVDGHYLRDLEITKAQAAGLGEAFAISKWSSATLASLPILDSYDMNKFFGWFYHDASDARIEIRYFPELASSQQWIVYRQPSPGSYYAREYIISVANNDLAGTRPFIPEANIALNAIFDNTVNSVNDRYSESRPVTHSGKPVTVKFEAEKVGVDGVKFNMSSISDVNTDWVSTINLPTPTIMGDFTFIGWKLNDNDSDIFRPGTPEAPSPFYLDSKYYGNREGNTLVFTAVALTADELSRSAGMYEKYLDDSGIVRLKKTGESHTVRIQDLSIFNGVDYEGRAMLDFGTAYGSGLKNTVNLQAGGRYPVADSPDKSRSITNNLINLPFVDNYAVGGRQFIGWKSSYDNKIYPAGLQYRLPRWMPTTAKINFTAVWADMRNLLDLDGNGGAKTWRDDIGNKKIGTTIRLPNLSRYGYDFVGWQNKVDDKMCDDNKIVITGKEQKLVAIWEAKKINRITLASVPMVGQIYLEKASTSYNFGETMVFYRYSGETGVVHNGWKFQLGESNKYNEFLFDATFCKKVPIKIDENFCKKYANSSRPNDFFDKEDTIIAWTV